MAGLVRVEGGTPAVVRQRPDRGPRSMADGPHAIGSPGPMVGVGRCRTLRGPAGCHRNGVAAGGRSPAGGPPPLL